MHPLKKAANILLEPAAVFLVLLITQGALRADRQDGPAIKSIKELEQLLETTVRQQDSGQAGDEAFDQSQVIEGGLIEEGKHNNQDRA